MRNSGTVGADESRLTGQGWGLQAEEGVEIVT